MEDDYVEFAEYLKTSIGTTITAIHEDEYEVIFHLSDGQMMIVEAGSDGGFSINIQTDKLH